MQDICVHRYEAYTAFRINDIAWPYTTHGSPAKPYKALMLKPFCTPYLQCTQHKFLLFELALCHSALTSVAKIVITCKVLNMFHPHRSLVLNLYTYHALDTPFFSSKLCMSLTWTCVVDLWSLISVKIMFHPYLCTYHAVNTPFSCSFCMSLAKTYVVDIVDNLVFPLYDNLN